MRIDPKKFPVWTVALTLSLPWFSLSMPLAFGDENSSQVKNSTLQITDVLRYARSQALEIKEAEANFEAQKATEASVDGAYDATVFSKFQLTKDLSEQNSQFAGEERKFREAEIGIRRLFATGTQAELKYHYERSFTEFPPGPPPPTMIVNPSHTSNLQLTLKQPLWRNFLAREVRLQKLMQSALTEASQLRVALQKQLSQAEAEQLYLNVAALQSQLSTVKQLVSKTQKFATMMKRRQEIGRADDIDVIAADSRLVQTDSQLLNLEISLEDSKQRLASLIGLNLDQVVIGADVLDTSRLEVPTLEVEKAIQLANEQRIDLKIAKIQLEPIEIQKKLAVEAGKPNIQVFGAIASNGIEADRDESLKEPFAFDHKSMLIGLELEWTPRNRKSSYEQFAAQAKKKSLEQSIQMSVRDLTRDIKIAIHQRRSADKQKEQALKQIKAFSDKISAEKRRYKQARTERITILSHEIEKLNANMNLISANLAARQAEAMLRLAMHSYSRE